MHKETTEDIRVTVIPFYMGYRDNQANNVYWVQFNETKKALIYNREVRDNLWKDIPNIALDFNI